MFAIRAGNALFARYHVCCYGVWQEERGIDPEESKVSEPQSEALKNIQMMIDSPADLSEAPPFVRGMDLSGLSFTKVEYGHFEMEWRVDAHLTHYDGIVPGGVVNVIADSGQSFAFYSTSREPEAYSTSEFTTRFLRPIQAGDTIHVVNEVVNRSKRLCIIEARMYNRATGKLCAMVTGTWMMADRELG